MDHMARMRTLLFSFPAFTPDEPELWVGLMRSHFAAYNINKGFQQYNCFLIVLGPLYKSLTRDLILDPPSEAELSDDVRYSELREELFERLRGHKVSPLPEGEKMGSGRKIHARVEESPIFPPFIPDDPPLWFGYMRSFFAVYDIRSPMQQYHSFLIAVDPQYASLIRDLVMQSPSEKDLSDDSHYLEKKNLLYRRLCAHKTLRLPEDGEIQIAGTWSKVSPFPPFMPNDPPLWFGLMRSYFVVYNIRCGLQQYHSFLVAVGPQYVSLIKDLILLPPSEDELIYQNLYQEKREELYERLRSRVPENENRVPSPPSKLE